MGKITRYIATFQLLSGLEPSGLKTYGVASAISITKGDAIHLDGNGYATNAVTALTLKFVGIAAADADNTSGADAAINVQVIPPLETHKFAVPVANALITQSKVGAVYDLSTVKTITTADTSISAGPGFYVDEIDVSADAITANAYGYAIGHFQFQS